MLYGVIYRNSRRKPHESRGDAGEELTGQIMPRTVFRWAAAGFFLLVSCASGHAAAAAGSGVESLYTSLKTSSCTQVIDETDVNQTPYLVCPGVAGYRLQIILVDSGRLSINVVTPARQRSSLNYQYVVTRSMDDVDDKAEWRVHRENGKVVPIALIIRVLVHGNANNPQRVTSAYWAVAKIVAGKACVTDSIREGSRPATEVRALADSAASRPCATGLPATAAAGIR
jgi:hypothetical protein